MIRGLGALLPSLSLLALTACGPDPQRAAEQHLSEEITRLREDRAPDRRAQITVVQSAPAHTPEGQAARDACVRAYTGLLDAEDAIAKAEARMKAETDLDPLAALTEVAAAEALLQKAKADMPACDAAAAKLALAVR